MTGVNDAVDNVGDARSTTVRHVIAGGGYDSVTVADVAATATDDDTVGVAPIALFQAHQTFVDVGFTPRSMMLRDLNGDDHLDIVTVNVFSHDVSVLLGNGDGTFRAQRTFGGGGPRRLAFGDLDGDGALDIVTANEESDDVSVRLGNGDGTFQAQERFGVGGNPVSVALGNLNGDGVLDIVIAKWYSSVSVFLGNGDETFQAQPTYGVDGNLESVALGDLNGDGVLDIVTTNWSRGNVSVLLGR